MNDSSAVSDSLPAYDVAGALARAGGDVDLARELRDMLLAELPAALDALRADLAQSDCPALAESAHRLRSATRYCAVPALDASVEALEQAARRGDLVCGRDCFDRVAAEIHRLHLAFT